MSAEETRDLVAIGAGPAGMAACLAAAEEGIDPLLLEKTPLLGGVTAYSNGQLWAAANPLELAAGIEDTEAAGLAYLTRLGAGFTDPTMAAAYAALAPRALTYFAELIGIRWALVPEMADYYYPEFEEALPTGRYLEVEPLAGAELGAERARLRVSPHVPYRMSSADMLRLGGGANAHLWDAEELRRRAEADQLASGTGLAGYFVKGMAAAGVEARTGVEVLELLLDGGRVAGVRVREGGEERPIRARRGVLLATGGYDWDPVDARAFEGQIGIHSAAPPAIRGDHLALASRAGAAVTQVPKPVRLGFPVPGQSDEGEPLWRIMGSFAFPRAILVNRRGERFADESFYPSVGHAVKAIDGGAQRFVNWPCWTIFDAGYRERYTFGPTPPGADFPPELGVVEAPDLAALAVAVGIDPDGLEATVARFNAFCADGVDADFGRGSRPWARAWYGDARESANPNLGPIDQPPFYAYAPGLVGTGIPTLGLRCDPHARVLDHSGTPVPGLYAAGNSAALTEVGAGYQSGVANMRSLAFGWSAARHAGGNPFSAQELVPAGA